MFERLLIANRGEIACRVAATARRLGIETVGVHSDPDRNARHVTVVDRSVALGGASPATSYLRGDAVIEAALATGCDAVHPGYGFLSENADFAQAVLDAGLAWVGPTPDQIRLLGDKVAAKAAAEAAGVASTASIVVEPGDDVPDLPFPLLIKAAAGGGGRGMRVVESPDDFADAVASATREAAAAFGDGTVFCEPFLARGRHVEVQVLGDHHGTVLVLGDRDCSVQRRNQKVIEEAPAPGLANAVRSELHRSARALAEHVGYRNAGTVEFLVGADGTIAFLEVNTRLQVEHPVTEAVTGLDLVELQLRVAAGEALPLGQDDVRLDGHAIEARVVAEDPSEGWLPQTGTVRAFHGPEAVRVDHGLAEGTVIGTDYDSLLAKVIAHADDRTTAARRLASALETTILAGVGDNRGQLAATLRHPAFLDPEALSTALLDDAPELGEASLGDADETVAHLVALAILGRRNGATHGSSAIAGVPDGWRNLRTQGERSTWQPSGGGDPIDVELTADSRGGNFQGEVLVGPVPGVTEDGTLAADERRRLTTRLSVTAADDPSTHAALVELDGVARRVEVRWSSDGRDAPIIVATPRLVTSWQRTPRFVAPTGGSVGAGPVSPLPGTVLAVHASAGDSVEADDVLVVVEAMKMEHSIRAGAAATVSEVRVAPGDRVDAGDLLVSLDVADEGDRES
ncbi:MAG: biotin carboxylase N-terminal domain-containing protein [Acidimicrobiales bacterium]